VGGKKSLRGTILSAGDNSVTFELETPEQGEEGVVEVPFAIITRGNLVFEEKADKGRSS
jgi:ribosome maturation factor RimP